MNEAPTDGRPARTDVERLVNQFLYAVGRARKLKTCGDPQWQSRWAEVTRLSARLEALARPGY